MSDNLRLRPYESAEAIYEQQRRQYPAITEGTEQVEIAKVAEGDGPVAEEAKRKFLLGNLGLAVTMVRPKNGFEGLTRDDMIQAGNLGLMRAVKGFDWRKGFKFSTYAGWWIKEKADREIDNCARLIRFPAEISRLVFKLDAARARQRQQTGHEPSIASLAKKMDLKQEQIIWLQSLPRVVLSLDEIVHSRRVVPDRSTATPFRYGDFLADTRSEEEYEAVERRVGLRGLTAKLALLRPIERRAIEVNIMDNKTQEEAAAELGITKDQLRMAVGGGLSRMRHPCMGNITYRRFLNS